MHLRFLALGIAFGALVLPLQAQAVKIVGPKDDTDINQWSDSVVRILSQNGTGDGFQTTASAMIYFGSGFLINDAGYIVTNNHVASRSPDTSESHSMCVVLETSTTSEGVRRYLHKATVVWFSPTDDLAILQCSGLHAKPIPFDLTPPKNGDGVHSLGYPTISDIVAGGQGEFSNFFRALADFVAPLWEQQSDWDITDVVDQRTWPTYCKPTRTDGQIRNADLLEGAWGGTDAQAQVPVIQHSLDILPGNSGGPLVSNEGGVIGVVGDGMHDLENGNENVKTEYATTVAPLVQWLDSASIPGVDAQHHYYVLQREDTGSIASAKARFLSPATIMMIILGLLLALVFELIILRLTWDWGVMSGHGQSVIPAMQGALSAASGVAAEAHRKAEDWTRAGLSGGKRLFGWFPLHMPNPAQLYPFLRLHPKTSGGALVLLACVIAYITIPPDPVPPAAKSEAPVFADTTKLSSAEISSLFSAAQIKPPASAASGSGVSAISTEFEKSLRTLWSILWRILLTGIVAMLVWRLAVGATWYFKKRASLRGRPGSTGTYGAP